MDCRHHNRWRHRWEWDSNIRLHGRRKMDCRHHNRWRHRWEWDRTRLLFSNIRLPIAGMNVPMDDISNPREAGAHNGG